MADKIRIYKITSPSGKVYIGQSWNISRRFKEYNYPQLGQPKLYNSLKKYGYPKSYLGKMLSNRIKNKTSLKYV